MESFRVLKKIGQGGFGRAYLVKSIDTQDLRVVKQIKVGNLENKILTRAMEEIKIMSKLKHFNIIHYRSHVLKKDSLLILMDYADGGDVATLIHDRNGKPWNEDIIIDYFVQMCLAVKYLHDRKIVHRDIKPSNFFLCKNGIIKLGDFGLSRLLPTTQAMLETQIGSPYYLSPEVCKGIEYNMKTDIWSLGCVLYEMCSLKHPFIGRTTREVMEKIIKSKTPLIPKYYDIDLQKIARMMLDKDPANRPTINELFSIPLIKYKSFALLGRTQARIELSHSIFHGYAPGITPDDFPNEILFVDDYNELNKEIREKILDEKLGSSNDTNNDCCNEKMEKNQVNEDEKSDGSNQKLKGDENEKGVGIIPKNHSNINQKNAHLGDKRYNSDDLELIDFMGIPMRLPHAKKTSTPEEKAEDLREFIECLVGKEKVEEIRSVLKKTKSNPITLHFKYPYKQQICIVKLVEKLIQYEQQISS